MANLSQQRRDQLLKFLEKLKMEHTDDDSLIAINELETALNEKKYGLIWEKHEERVDIEIRTKVPVFSEVKEKEICKSKDGYLNFLLEGDNLHSLRLLEKTSRGKVDLIYIDPPYNTGSKDFIYDDALVELEDGFRHSKWLSFIEERLSIAYKLLSKGGTIFISIDDNEQAQLKLLCDSIFGENNFIANIVWQKRTSPDSRKKLSNGHEYILVYAKNAKDALAKFNLIDLDDKDRKNYKNPDNDTRGAWVSSDFTAQGFRPNQMYTITTPEGVSYTPGEGHCWKNIEQIYLKQLSEGRFWFGKNGKGMPRRKTYLSEREGKNMWTWWPNSEVGHTQEATQEITSLFGTKTVFDYPKPTRLIKRIIQIATAKDSIVLDFFSGSGTTGQAVLEQNAKDKGTRQFILCNNNENGICERVTYKRIEKIINGYTNKKNDVIDGISSNLKYYKTDYIEKVSDNGDYNVSERIMEHIKEMVQLEQGVSIDNENYILLLSDEEADELEKNAGKLKNCKGIYISSQVLLNSTQESLFKNIEIKQIPDYYFENELREVGEIW